MPTTVRILRDLWRFRLVVVAIYLVALVVGVSVAFQISFPPKLQSRQYDVGVATVRVLVDTPTSQVIEVAPKGSDTLAARATLLANLMVDGTVKDAIATRAGLQPDTLMGISDTAAPDVPPEKRNPRGYVLETRVASSKGGDQLPIIEISTQGPDMQGATRLANAAVAGLMGYLSSQAAQDRVPDARRLRVSGLGSAQAATVVRGPSSVIAVFVMLLTFGIGCGVLLVVCAVLRDWWAALQGEDLIITYDDEDGPGEKEKESLLATAPDDGVRDAQAPLAVVTDQPEPQGEAPDERSGDNWLVRTHPRASARQ